jgi:hypothetical protein
MTSWRGKSMDSEVCYVCGKENLSKNEIGLTKKLLSKNTKIYYCLDCLADYIEVPTEFLIEKIVEFKAQGCDLF